MIIWANELVKHRKLARERNSQTAPMAVDISAVIY